MQYERGFEQGRVDAWEKVMEMVARAVSAPKMAEVVCAHNFFWANRLGNDKFIADKYRRSRLSYRTILSR
jgi:hypothetical protein